LRDEISDITEYYSMIFMCRNQQKYRLYVTLLRSQNGLALL